MYFFKDKGKQCVDFKGNLILTHNDQLISARAKSAAPGSTQNIKYILITKLNFFQKISAMFTVFGFIWGKPAPLVASDTNLNKPAIKAAKNPEKLRSVPSQFPLKDEPDNPVAATPRDWVEDFPLENGNYENKCIKCDHTFIGHKRRHICKDCYTDLKK